MKSLSENIQLKPVTDYLPVRFSQFSEKFSNLTYTFLYFLLSQVVIEEDDKFLKLLELLGNYQEQGKHITKKLFSNCNCQR